MPYPHWLVHLIKTGWDRLLCPGMIRYADSVKTAISRLDTQLVGIQTRDMETGVRIGSVPLASAVAVLNIT